MQLSTILLLISLMMFSSCAGMMAGRTFIDEMDRESDGLFIAGRDFRPVAGDSGLGYRSKSEIIARTPFSERELETLGESSLLERELQSKEMLLSTEDRMQYREAVPYLDTNSEKIYFLNLSWSEREDYLDTRRIKPVNSMSGSRGLASVGSQQDRPVSGRGLYLGMTKDSVVRKWGRPLSVDIAGNPKRENERWAFEGNGSTHYVYFEDGTVQGWKTD